MIEKVDYLLNSISYWYKIHVLGKKIPFIAGLVINEDCNLNCRHCSVNKSETKKLTFDEVKDGLIQLKNRGIRSIAITGGEPFMWFDTTYTIESIIRLTRELGFKVSSVYTNGTFPLNISADNIFVSMDGTKDITAKLRGDIFDDVLRTIQSSNHPSIFINFTINNKNKDCIEEFLQFVKTIKNIKGTFFYFHTPYYGIDDLFIEKEERFQIAEKLLRLKKKYKILNSISALIDYINDTWERPSDVCYVYSNKKIMFKCCREVNNSSACEHCGYLGYLEVQNIIKNKFSAVKEAFNYMPSKKARNICC